MLHQPVGEVVFETAESGHAAGTIPAAAHPDAGRQATGAIAVPTTAAGLNASQQQVHRPYR